MLVAALVAVGVVQAHGPAKSRAPRKVKVTAEERAAFEAARPALEKHCFRCHARQGRKAKAKTLAHLSFDRYLPAGHHAHEAGAAVRRVLVGTPVEGPSMPSDDPGAVEG